MRLKANDDIAAAEGGMHASDSVPDNARDFSSQECYYDTAESELIATLPDCAEDACAEGYQMGAAVHTITNYKVKMVLKSGFEMWFAIGSQYRQVPDRCWTDAGQVQQVPDRCRTGERTGAGQVPDKCWGSHPKHVSNPFNPHEQTSPSFNV